MNTVNVSLKDIYLDPNNYRLRSKPQYSEVPDLTDDKLIGKALQQRTKNLISGKNNFEIKDLIDSFKSNGFLKVDNILVKKLSNNSGYVVIEGNRRIAALKAIQKSYEEGFDIGLMDSNIFEDPIDNDSSKGLEVVLYEYANTDEYLILMGLRHVSGNKKWDRYNQAKLISELHQGDYSISDIANRLGIANKKSVQQQLDAYYAINAFIENKENYVEDNEFNPHDKFMIFVEVLLKSNVKNWLSWDDSTKKFQNDENLKRFYTWISPSYPDLETDDDELESEELMPPIIINHKQIRLLNEVVDDEDSLEIMEGSRDVSEALEQNDGYTQKKFSKELLKSESILKNMKFGNSMSLDTNDSSTLKSIIRIAQRMLGNNDSE